MDFTKTHKTWGLHDCSEGKKTRFRPGLVAELLLNHKKGKMHFWFYPSLTKWQNLSALNPPQASVVKHLLREVNISSTWFCGLFLHCSGKGWLLPQCCFDTQVNVPFCLFICNINQKKEFTVERANVFTFQFHFIKLQLVKKTSYGEQIVRIYLWSSRDILCFFCWSYCSTVWPSKVRLCSLVFSDYCVMFCFIFLLLQQMQYKMSQCKINRKFLFLLFITLL